MGKIFIVLFAVALIYFVYTSYTSEEKGGIPVVPTPTESPRNVEASINDSTHSLFVPYWSLSMSINQNDYDSLIYFGIAPNEFGQIARDPGYQGLIQFKQNTSQAKKRLLAMRMISTNVNSVILKEPELQKKIISESITIAKNNNFQGIVLDLETSSLPFDSVINRINSFVNLYYTSVKKENLEFTITMYADVFYRVRPFDVEKLAKTSDGILIMAYDFHKAGGTPGPNFPLSGKEKYGYDFKTMIDDFLNVVPREKLTVIFGLYGYDWTVDEEGRSRSVATSITLHESNLKFLNGCKLDNCEVRRDSESSEMHVRYNEGTASAHIVWFEDMESVKKKKEYLLQKGINSFSLWAHSYF